MSSNRYLTLDSLRGIAALVVVFHHCFKSKDMLTGVNGEASGIGHFIIGNALHYTPLKILVGGRPPVILFFVLSGFVLSAMDFLSYRHYLVFIVRRILRIYVPFFVAIVLAVFLFYIIAPNSLPDYSKWFNESSWSVPLTFDLVLGHLLMVGDNAHITLDNPMWTLVHELRISLVFPLIAFMCGRMPLRSLMLFSLIYAVSVAILNYIPAGTIQASFVETFQYLLMFAIGCLLYNKRSDIATLVQSLPSHVCYLWVAFSLAALMAPGTYSAFTTLFYAAGSAGIIAFSVSANEPNFLTTGWCRWLGRVSYSLYLTHMLVLLSVIHLMHKYASVWVLLPLAIAISLVFSNFFYHLVEKPAIDLSRYVSSRRKYAFRLPSSS